MSSVYGSDTSCTSSYRPGVIVTGPLLVAEACYRRLTTRRGQLLEDLDYGLPLDDFLGSEYTPVRAAQIAGAVRGELLKDDRLGSCVVNYDLVQVGAAITLNLDVACECAEGPFDLSVALTATSIDVVIGRREAA